MTNNPENFMFETDDRPSIKTLNLLDCAEQHVIEMVRARVRQQVEETLLSEFAGLIQAETDKALSQICFRLAAEKDLLSRQDNLHILVTWAKAKEVKKSFREKKIIVEEIQ